MRRIPKTSAKEIEKYLKKWNSSGKYVLPENALNKLFLYTFPTNDGRYFNKRKCIK